MSTIYFVSKKNDPESCGRKGGGVFVGINRGTMIREEIVKVGKNKKFSERKT